MRFARSSITMDRIVMSRLVGIDASSYVLARKAPHVTVNPGLVRGKNVVTPLLQN